MSKHILSAALALALSLSLAVPAFAEEEGPFDDVPLDHWAVEAIRQAKEEAIISGMYYRNFAPDDRLTTAQFATIVTKAFYWRDFGRDPDRSRGGRGGLVRLLQGGRGEGGADRGDRH